jgi:hypothetical protein
MFSMIVFSFTVLKVRAICIITDLYSYGYIAFLFMGTWALSMDVRQPECGTNISRPSGAEV